MGVCGYPGKAKSGQVSIYITKIELLSPCLHMLPNINSKNPLDNVETRFRQRYLDLIINPRVRDVFYVRAKVVNYIRRFLDMRGFLEVETPMMGMLAGGATAKVGCCCVLCYNGSIILVVLSIPLFIRINPITAFHHYPQLLGH